MEGYILAAMGSVLLLLALLVLRGGRVLRKVNPPELAKEPGRWPPVALIVPVAGAAPGLRDRLSSLLNQDYPDYQAIFVTQDQKDPATAVILATMSGATRARLVISGRAQTCGQKNHNLLAGLRLIGDETETLAFCDSNQLAPANFLKELVRPIALGEAAVTSGYHHIIPQDSRIATLGRAITVLTLYLTKGFKRLNQPWGGATAIDRRLFQALKVARLWAETVVDDVSLAARLIRAKILVGEAPGASLATPLEGESLKGWSQWLTRQWLYLKFCLPGTWVAAGLAQHLFSVLVLLAGGQCLLGFLGWISPLPALAATLFLILLSWLGVALRPLHPRAGPLTAWLAAFYASIFMASWCHLKTWFSREIHWRGISYRVGRGGRVTEVREG